MLLACQLFSEDSKAELLYSAMYSFYTSSQCTVIPKFHFLVVEATSPESEVLPCKYVSLTLPLMVFLHLTENVGLSSRQEGCWLLSESGRTDAVMQVIKWASVDWANMFNTWQNTSGRNLHSSILLFTHSFDWSHAQLFQLLLSPSSTVFTVCLGSLALIYEPYIWQKTGTAIFTQGSFISLDMSVRTAQPWHQVWHRLCRFESVWVCGAAQQNKTWKNND